MSVWQLLAEDLRGWKRVGFLGGARANTQLKLAEALTLVWRYPGVRATMYYRFSHAAHLRHVPLVPMLLFRRNLRYFGIDIIPSVPVGPVLYLPHPVGVVVMATSIGRNCHIISQVTVGMRNEHAFPTIGDNVTIGAGARVLGGITIGEGAQIGATAVV
ncbi:MAG: serine O-acetyltransferase, partial [Ktedonobacterales bacterium]